MLRLKQNTMERHKRINLQETKALKNISLREIKTLESTNLQDIATYHLDSTRDAFQRTAHRSNEVVGTGEGDIAFSKSLIGTGSIAVASYMCWRISVSRFEKLVGYLITFNAES